MNKLTVTSIPAFDDNYIWLMDNGENAVIVDPGDADPVIEVLNARQLSPQAILITHKHWDHIGGIDELKALWPGVTVYGPENEPIKEVEKTLRNGDTIELLDGDLCFKVLDVPGHTEGHIAYYGNQMLFCGDTLFAGGCGRIFSGTYAQLAVSLQQLSSLPDDTQVYCAHEYTLANLGFGLWAEPDNHALKDRIEKCRVLRGNQQPTVPSTIAIENQTNPFMRLRVPQVKAAAEQWAGKTLPDSAAVFTALRNWKDKDYD